MQSRSIEIVVGLFVLGAVAALAFLATRVANQESGSLADGYSITASFDNVGGLTVKAPVSMAGVKIGRVTSIEIDRDDYTAVVTLKIGKRFDNLPKDTSAAILTAGLLGAQYVGLEPGGEEQYLQQDDKVMITQSAVVLEQLIGQMLFDQAGGGNESSGQ